MESTAVNETHLEPHCTFCNSSANEAYLVNCALCNSTFHTGCVGLGWDIPEAELYCPDCDTCIKDSSKMQPDHHDDSRYVDQETMDRIRMIGRGGDHSISMHELVADIRGEDMANPPSNTQLTRGGDRLSTNRERLEQRIQAFRDNWGRVQSGSVAISDQLVEPYQRTDGTRPNNPITLIPTVGRDDNNRESCDIEKSWEMMEKTRLILEKKESRSNVQQTSQTISITGKPKPSSEHKWPPKKKPRAYGESSVSAHNSNHEVPHPNRGFNRLSSNDHTLIGSKDKPIRQMGTMQGVRLSASSQVPHQMGLSFLWRGTSSETEKRDRARNEDVKAEIQSLVKYSLSALPKDKRKLGTNGYKEIARVSTHTILAMCGLEHDVAVVARSFSRPLCNHNKDMFNLMAGSCRDCFNGFVKQVVEFVFSEKM